MQPNRSVGERYLRRLGSGSISSWAAGAPKRRVSFTALALLAGSLLTVGLAEVMATRADPRLSWALCAALLIALLLHAGRQGPVGTGRLSLALAPIPLMRVLAPGIWTLHTNALERYLIVSALLAVVVVAVAGHLGLHWDELGLGVGAGWLALIEYSPVAATGAPAGILGAYWLQNSPLIQVLAPLHTVGSVILACMWLGLLEELIFRGLLLKVCLEVLGPWLAIAYVAVLYTVLQLGYGSVGQIVLAFGASMLFGWVVTRTRTLWLAGLGHGVINMAVVLLVPLWFRK